MKKIYRLSIYIILFASILTLTGCSKTKTTFEEAFPFSEDLACVKIDELYGFIDNTGEFVIEPQYETSGYFVKGISIVKKDGFFGVIDKNNKEIVPFIYEDAQTTYIDDLITVKKDGKYGCINLKNETVVDFISTDIIYVSSYGSDHKIAIVTGDDGKKGFIDLVTNFSVPTIYTDVNAWGSPDINIIGLSLGGYKHGFVNLDTQTIVEPLSSNYIWFYNNYSVYGNLATISVNGKYGIINSQGEIIIEPTYSFLGSFDDNGLAFVDINNKFGCINTKGELVIDAVYDSPFYFTNGLAKVSMDGKAMIINTTGEIVDIDPSTFSIRQPIDFSQDLENPCIISYYLDDNGTEKAMALSPDGEILFKTTYDDIYPMADGLYTVFNIGLMGCVNERGIEILPPEYDQLYYVGNNLFIVSKGNKYGVMDAMRNELIPIEYDEIFKTEGDLIFMRSKEKCSYYNIETKALKKDIFDEVIPYTTYPIPVRKGDQWFYLDENGENFLK